MFLKNLQNSQENACARISFLIKLQAEAEVFFCEFCNKNTFFTEHLQTIASVDRISRPEVFYKIVAKNLVKFTGKHLRQSLFFNKIATLVTITSLTTLTTLLKNTHRQRCFPVKLAKFQRTSF